MIRVSYKTFDLSLKYLNRTSLRSLSSLQRKINRNDSQLYNHSIVRFNSSLVSGEPSSIVQELVQTSLAVEPTLSSLGLGGYSPKGLLQSGLELLHVGLDIPWWSSIVIGTICIRLAIFPLVIISQRNAANMNNHMPTLQRLQEKMKIPRMEGDSAAVLEISNEMTSFMKKNKINPLKSMLTVGAQIPIFLSVFTGLKEMSSLPVASMQTGGILWFTDLTVPDPMHLLPLMTAASLLATIEVGVDGIKTGQIPSSTIKFVMRTMPFISIPIMINFPAAMLCYWFTSNTFSLVQVLFLRIPKVKEFFSIPALVNHDNAYPIKKIEGPELSFTESFKLSLENLELAKEIEERKRLDALKMKEATNKQKIDDANDNATRHQKEQ